MAKLITLKGPQTGLHFPCESAPITIGRQPDCTVCLDAPAVSRVHAKITIEKDQYFIEDLQSSNGTFINGKKIDGKSSFGEDDTLQIGPYHLALRLKSSFDKKSETESIIRSQINALSGNRTLFSQNAEHKLQVLIEISRNLGRTLEMEPLLQKLLEQLFILFPQADRGMIILCEGEGYVPKAQRSRAPMTSADSMRGPRDAFEVQTRQGEELPYSRSLIRRALDDGVGLLSEDVNKDLNLPRTETLINLNLRSLMCVPLLGLDRRQLGVMQLDCSRPGLAFSHEDLEVLTALGLQVSGVLENAALHEELIREERTKRELALGQEIQQEFLPTNFAYFAKKGIDVFARVCPAREVSGDLYDLFMREDGRLAFFLGDVSGKGVPAALFMIMVRTLIRHLAQTASSPGEMLIRLNEALVAENPTSLFVTLAHGLYDPKNGEITIVSGGQPNPLIRRSNGSMEEVKIPPCLMLGQSSFIKPPTEVKITLKPGDILALYSDGMTEAFDPEREMFDTPRLCQAIADAGSSESLATADEQVRDAIARFTKSADLQDDQTLFLLRCSP